MLAMTDMVESWRLFTGEGGAASVGRSIVVGRGIDGGGDWNGLRSTKKAAAD